MTNTELKNQIIKNFPEYEFLEDQKSESLFFTKNIKLKEYRDSTKNLVRIGRMRHIFISSEMYPNTDRNFKYAIIYTPSEMRLYKHKTWLDFEENKQYVSGKTNEELYDKIAKQFQF